MLDVDKRKFRRMEAAEIHLFTVIPGNTDKLLINREVSVEDELINISTRVLFFPLYIILFRALLPDIWRIRNIPITGGKELTRRVKKICAVMM